MKKILLFLTGSVAACRGTAIVRALQKQNLEVMCVLTEAAQRFVGVDALAAISRNPVFSNSLFSEAPSDGILAKSHFPHLEWAQSMDAFLVAPATADSLFRLAHGSAEGVAEVVALATRAPILVAPAMNPAMLHSAVVQENLSILQSRGVEILPTKMGIAACGDEGPGKLLDPEIIAQYVLRALSPQIFAQKKVFITLGGTFEKIDPVRGMSNFSSGRMGIALAEAFWRAGAEVSIVAGTTSVPIPSFFENVVRVESARKMAQEAEKMAEKCDIAFFTAAVSDFTPKHFSSAKISSESPPSIVLEKTTDIAALCGKKKKSGQHFFGFSLGDDATKAESKRTAKNLDGIFWNTETNIGVNSGEVVSLFPDIPPVTLAGTKQKIAEDILVLVHSFVSKK